ncbi:MAG TPA: aspartate aminotransferase family protein, partial [Candidatus Eisenbacteria bacterium]|nr:aspartate aminotransferase family protein [Candidatus Eisenbacteria bacterium]
MKRRASLQGDELPAVVTPPPGPKSRAAAKRLRRAEGAAIWGRDESPIVWSRARGAVVEDLDGNRYLDFTSGFGVASLGHAAPEVKRAISAQAGRLVQGLGDLMPHAAREKLVRRLSKLGGRLDRVLLASTGAEAVELALKTAAIATGRRRFVAFQGAYHGDSYGALEVTDHPKPPEPVRAQLQGRAIHVSFPYPYRSAPCARRGDAGYEESLLGEAFASIDDALRTADPPGALIVEPIQGRAGAIVPPAGFLPRLCRLARERRLLVIYDEILTGAGRTGPFWAWERSGPDAEPDLLCAGKGLGGGVAIAALLGKPATMEAWRRHVPPSGEAPHASTFYAHPLACAGAIAAIERLTSPEVREHADRMGAVLAEGLTKIAAQHRAVGEARFAGLLGAIELVRDREGKEPAPDILDGLVSRLLARGILALPGGLHENVL